MSHARERDKANAGREDGRGIHYKDVQERHWKELCCYQGLINQEKLFSFLQEIVIKSTTNNNPKHNNGDDEGGVGQLRN